MRIFILDEKETEKKKIVCARARARAAQFPEHEHVLLSSTIFFLVFFSTYTHSFHADKWDVARRKQPCNQHTWFFFESGNKIWQRRMKQKPKKRKY